LTLYHCKKGFVILTIIFFTRVATVDMVLWEDEIELPNDILNLVDIKN